MKKTAAQLGHEITKILTSRSPVTIFVHLNENDNDEGEVEDTYTISDDGGEFDDDAELDVPDVQGNLDERRDYYRRRGRDVILHIPRGRGWQ